MKKMLSFVLLLCMVFSVCSCSQQSEGEMTPEYNEELGDTDFMGEEFLFMHNNEEHSTGEEYFGYIVNTEFADLALKRVREVEEKYHVKITEQKASDLVSRVQLGTMSGVVGIDAIQSRSGTIAGLLRSGYFANLVYYQQYLDYTNDEKWGNIENLKPLFWDN